MIVGTLIAKDGQIVHLAPERRRSMMQRIMPV